MSTPLLSPETTMVSSAPSLAVFSPPRVAADAAPAPATTTPARTARSLRLLLFMRETSVLWWGGRCVATVNHGRGSAPAAGPPKYGYGYLFPALRWLKWHLGNTPVSWAG